jgi:hypothetical protein
VRSFQPPNYLHTWSSYGHSTRRNPESLSTCRCRVWRSSDGRSTRRNPWGGIRAKRDTRLVVESGRCLFMGTAPGLEPISLSFLRPLARGSISSPIPHGSIPWVRACRASPALPLLRFRPHESSTGADVHCEPDGSGYFFRSRARLRAMIGMGRRARVRDATGATTVAGAGGGCWTCRSRPGGRWNQQKSLWAWMSDLTGP